VFVFFCLLSAAEEHRNDSMTSANTSSSQVEKSDKHRTLEQTEREARMAKYQGVNSFTIFDQYRAKREKVMKRLRAMINDYEGLYFKGKPSPYPRVHIALAAELRRLQKEEGLIQRWAANEKFRRPDMPYMVESMFILDYTEIMTAYGEEMNKLNREGRLGAPQIMVQAARKVTQAYDEETRRSWTFNDEPILKLSSSAPKFKPVVEALFTGNDDDVVIKRMKFFSDYSNRLTQMNKKEVDDYGKAVAEYQQKLTNIRRD
jgi:hypothetical protein